MIITRISATGLKGGNFTHPLHPAQAIVGPNFTGKTAIIEAIRLCLIGYLPEVGKTPRSTWELASDGEMRVEVAFDHPPMTLTRRFWCGMENKIKTEVEGFHPCNGDLPLLQADRYFGMTDTERTNYVFEKVTLPDSFSQAAILADIERISFGDEHTEQIEEAKADCVAKIRAVMSAEPTIQAALNLALEHLQTQFTYWNQRAKNTQGAVVVMAELKLREKNIRAAAAGVDEELANRRAQLEEFNIQAGKLTAKEGEAERITTRIKTIGIQLAGLPTDWDERIAKGARLFENEKLKLGVELSEDQYKNVINAITVNRQERAEVNRVYQTDLQSLAHAREGLASLGKMECCPYCKSTGDKWKENLREEMQATVDKTAPRIAPATAEIARLDAEWKDMELTIGEADTMRITNATIRNAMSHLSAAHSHAIQQKAADEARRVELQEELKTLRESRPQTQLDIQEALGAIEEKVTKLRITIRELEARKNEETRLLQDLRRAAEAELEHLDAAAHVIVIKEVGKLIKDRREAMVTEVFGTLLGVANQVCGNVLRSPLALHENTIGRWDDRGKFIPHRVFSGTEKALTYIAIAVALSSQSKLRLVILDEYGRLDTFNQSEVIQNLVKCIKAKLIDQFIVVGTNLPALLPASVNVIHTS